MASHVMSYGRSKIKIVSNALYSYPAADLTCYSSHWRSIQQRTSEANYQYTLGKLHNDVFNFFGLHNFSFWTAQIASWIAQIG